MMNKIIRTLGYMALTVAILLSGFFIATIIYVLWVTTHPIIAVTCTVALLIAAAYGWIADD